MDIHHRHAHTDTSDLGFVDTLVLAIKMADIRRRTAHIETDDLVESFSGAGCYRADNTACGSGKNTVLALEPGAIHQATIGLHKI